MNPESNDDQLLEGNVAALLKAADAAPRMSPDARGRVLEALLSAQRARTIDEGKIAAKGPGPGASRPRVDGRLWSSLPRSRAGRAGLAASAAGFALLVGYLVTRPPVSGGAVSYENAGPGPRVIALRDGSNVTLDVGAAIVERAPREISLLRGQAVFEVVAASAGKASFDVETVAGRAAATGSRFLVKASTASSEVAVARGVVEVTAEQGASAELRAGEEGVLSGEAPPKAKAAPRVSYLFDFARKTEAEALPGLPESRGTLVGRDPRWQKEAPIDLRELAVDVHVEGGFARTTIDQTFFNPKPRQLEGIYSFPMPKGAAISRLAMYVDGELMESAIVDRSRGRDIYEGIVEQRRDPALLEWMTGNTFRMRIFPIPGRTDKRIFMSYTQPLEHLYGADRLVVPIPSIDQPAARATFSVKVVGGARYEISSPSHAVAIADKGADRLVTFEQRDAHLGQDLVISMREKDHAGGSDEARVFDEGDKRYLLARSSPDLRALAPATKSRPGRRIAVLFDVSASRSQQSLAAQARFVDGLIDAFDETDEVTFLTVGHEVTLMPGGLVAARNVRREDVGRFLSAEADGLGDTRLDLGLAAASEALGEGPEERQVIYVGDGVFVGQGLTPSKKSQAEQLTSALAGRARFIGVGIGDTVDRATLDAVANATHGLSVEVGESEDLGHRAFDLVATTYTPCLSDLSAELVDASGRPLPGATVALRSTRVCDGERVEVVSRASRDLPAAKVRVRGRVNASSPTSDGEAWETSIDVSSAEGGAAFLPRVFAERRVSALLADEPPNAGQAESPNAKEIVSLARQYFLVTPFTSLLVLENDAMYKEYGVEKKKAEGWALYDAPQKVKVSYEPLGSGAISDAGGWELLERSPTQLFYDRQSPLENRLGLGLIGAIGRGGFATKGTGEGFGSGSGRLGGRHREEKAEAAPRAAYKTTTDALRQGFAFNKRLGGDFRLESTLSEPAAADAETRSWHSSGTAQVVDGRDWIEQAFQGGSMAAFQYESDPRLSDLTELVPGMFALPVDARGDLLRAVSSGTELREPAALEFLEKAAAKLTGSFETEPGRRLTLLPGAGVMESNALALGSTEIVTADKQGLSHAYPELGLRTKRSVGPELVWWLADEAPMVAPIASWTEGLRVELASPDTVRIRASAAAMEADVSLPELLFTFDDDMRVVRLVRITGGRRETITMRSEKGDVVVFSEGRTRRFRSIAAPSHEEVQLVDVVLPLANPNRWLDRIKEPAALVDVAFARRQLLASYAAMGDEQALARELDALAVANGTLSRGEVVLASRAMAHSADAQKLLTRLAPDDPVRRYLEATAMSSSLREAAFKRIASDSAGSLVGALAGYRNVLAVIERGTATETIAKGLRLLVERYPNARFFQYAVARQANDRLGWQDGKLVIGLWETLARDEVLRPVADRHIALLQRGVDSEQAARRATRAIDAAFERGYAFDLDWSMRSAVTQARGDAGLELLLAKWRGKIRKSGSAAQVLAFVRASLDPYGRSGQDGDVGAVLRRLPEIDVDEDTRLRIAVLLVGSNRLSEAKIVLDPLLDDEARPVVLELGAELAERAGDLDGAARLLDRLLLETADAPVELSVVRGWYEKLIDLELRKARNDQELDSATSRVLTIASRWRREDGSNPAIDEVCAAALFRVGREKEGKLYLSSIVERRPAEGGSWGRAGELLQVQGDLDGALASFSHAALVEPTNPTWDLRHAQALLTRAEPNDEATARAVLARIAERQASAAYQPRFSNVVSDASRLGESLKLSP